MDPARRVATLLVLAALPAMGAAPVLAQSADDPPLVEEFFFTESAHPQEKGDVQVTFSVFHRRHDGRTLTDVGALAEYGITEWLQVEVQLPWIRRREADRATVSGIGDTEIGILAALRRDPSFFVSTGAEIALPTGSSSLGFSNEVDVEPFVIAGHRFRESELQAALSAELEGGRVLSLGLAYVHAFPRWRTLLELNDRTGRGMDAVQLSLGAYWKPSRSCEIGLAVPIGLHDAARVGVLVKATAEF